MSGTKYYLHKTIMPISKTEKQICEANFQACLNRRSALERESQDLQNKFNAQILNLPNLFNAQN